DHRHRLREGRRSPDPGGCRADRGSRRRQRGLLGHRADRPDRAGAGAPARGRRSGGRRPGQQGARGARDRDAHRVPRVFTTRPRVGLLARSRI
ncbi:MAG: Transcriptional regulator, AsnC family, partial [uncultured Nocardioidaceae bacterium]